MSLKEKFRLSHENSSFKSRRESMTQMDWIKATLESVDSKTDESVAIFNTSVDSINSDKLGIDAYTTNSKPA